MLIRTTDGEAKNVVDGDKETAWDLAWYKSPKFGNLKDGMGVLINLGTPRQLAELRVSTSAPGVVMDVRYGTSDPGDSRSGDEKLLKDYKRLGDGDAEKSTGTNWISPAFEPDQKYQYVLVFLTELPKNEDGPGYKVNVNEIELYGY